MVKTEPVALLEIGKDDYELAQLLQTLWSGRKIIALVTIVFLALAVLYLNVATYRYSARLVVAPTQSRSGGLSAAIGGLGGLASLAGVNIPQDQGSLNFSLYLEGLHSRSLADALVRHSELMHTIYVREWNEEASRWQQPVSLVSSAANVVKGALGIPVRPWRQPDGGRLQEYLEREVTVIEDPKKPFAVVAYRHPDPIFAAKFLDVLNTELDDMIRAKALARSTSNIAYLSGQLGEVTIAEHRLAITQALSEQEKQRMAANSSAPFAADPFGAASASAYPTSPRPALALGVSVLGGLVVGILLVLVIAQLRLQTGRVALETTT